MALAHDHHGYDEESHDREVTLVVSTRSRPAESGDHPRTDLAQHKATWAGMVHFAKWFSLHLAVDLFGLVLLMLGNQVIGFAFIAIGSAMFAYGIYTTPAVARRARDEARALANVPLPVDAEARVV